MTSQSFFNDGVQNGDLQSVGSNRSPAIENNDLNNKKSVVGIENTLETLDGVEHGRERHGEGTAEVEEEEKEPEIPYEPPAFNFIKIEFGGRFSKRF